VCGSNREGVGSAAAGTHNRHALEMVMVEKCRQIVSYHCHATTRQSRRAAIPRPVRHQVAHPQVSLDGWIRVSVQPGSGRALQAQDRGPAWFAPPSPGQRATVGKFELAVFVTDAVFGYKNIIDSHRTIIA
jgi:hypothetical protein